MYGNTDERVDLLHTPLSLEVEKSDAIRDIFQWRYQKSTQHMQEMGRLIYVRSEVLVMKKWCSSINTSRADYAKKKSQIV